MRLRVLGCERRADLQSVDLKLPAQAAGDATRLRVQRDFGVKLTDTESIGLTASSIRVVRLVRLH